MAFLLGIILVAAMVVAAHYAGTATRLKRQVSDARTKRYAAEAQAASLRAELERTAKTLDAEAARLRSPAPRPAGWPR